MFKDLPEGQTHSMAERYTVKPFTADSNIVVDSERPDLACLVFRDNNGEYAALIARALNKLAELESVTSIGEANVPAPKENE